MAVQNSLASRQRKTAFDVYLTQDAAKQILFIRPENRREV